MLGVEKTKKLKILTFFLTMILIGILGIVSFRNVKAVLEKKDYSNKHMLLNDAVSYLKTIMSLQRELRELGYTLIPYNEGKKKILSRYQEKESKIERSELLFVTAFKKIPKVPALQLKYDIWRNMNSDFRRFAAKITELKIASFEWLERCNEILEEETELIKVLQMPQTNVELVDYLSTLEMEIVVIESYIGLERANLDAVIVGGSPIVPEKVSELNYYRGIVDGFLKNLTASKILPSIPGEVVNAIEEFEREFLVEYESVRQSVYEAGTEGEPYPLTAEQWRKTSSRAIASAEKLFETISESLDNIFLMIERRASRSLTVTLSETFVFLFLFISLIWWLQRNLINSIRMLAESNESLEMKVSERTQELVKAKEIAESSAEVQSRFLANMSHEIRTPLNSIVGFLGLSIENGELPLKTRKHLDIAFSSSKGLLRIINDILDLSKLDAGKLQIENTKFYLPRTVKDALSNFDLILHEKMLELNLDIHSSLFNCRLGDSARLVQILLNLVGNAIKFTKKGSVSISVTPTDKDNFIRFSIKDTGIGIPKNKLNSILQPFTQEDVSITREFGGTGLGTSIAKQLIELMEGELTVESELGKGSTFQFTVRLDSPECSASCFLDCEMHGPVEENASQLYPRTFTILVAEDIPANIELLTIRLNMQGHHVKVAKNGREAVKLYNEQAFDIILMDVQMPEMGGLEATRQIRQLESKTDSHIPIIALTASVLVEDKKKCIEAGMDSVVGKPIDFSVLFKKMEEIVPEGIGNVNENITVGIGAESGNLMPHLDGIDTISGLNTWQDKQAYIRALINFVNSYKNVADRLSNMVNENKWDDAYHLTHTLKGISGNLAMVKLSKTSTALNQAIKDKQRSTSESILATLAGEMASVQTAIKKLPQPGTMIKTKKNINLERSDELLNQLKEELLKDDPDPAEIVLDKLDEYFNEKELQPIRSALDNFDFKKAIDLAEQLSSNIKSQSNPKMNPV